jgi:hypothetical protein
MSGQPLIHPNDASKYRSAYLATLGLQAQINAKNLNSNVVYKQTGTPAQPTDSRTTTEKLADIEKLKVELQGQLLQITDGTQTQKIISQLDDSEVQYLAQNMPAIIKDFRSKFAKGITAGVFLPMLRSMINQAVVFSGVSYGIKNVAGNSLVGTIGQFINTALTPIQYDLLEDYFQGESDVIKAIEEIRNAFQKLPQMNEKLRALPLDGVREVIQQLEYSFSDVPTRTIIDQYLRQFRVGGQPAQQARQELGQILIDAAMKSVLNKKEVQRALEDNVQLAQRLADMVVETSNLELVVKPQLSIVPFRRIPERGSIDQHNSSIAKQMQLDGDAYVTSAIVDGKTVLRPCFTNFRTSLEDVRELLDIVERTGARLERQESEG